MHLHRPTRLRTKPANFTLLRPALTLATLTPRLQIKQKQPHTRYNATHTLRHPKRKLLYTPAPTASLWPAPPPPPHADSAPPDATHTATPHVYKSTASLRAPTASPPANRCSPPQAKIASASPSRTSDDPHSPTASNRRPPSRAQPSFRQPAFPQPAFPQPSFPQPAIPPTREIACKRIV